MDELQELQSTHAYAELMQVFQRFDEQVAAKMDARKDLSMELIAPIKENKEA